MKTLQTILMKYFLLLIFFIVLAAACVLDINSDSLDSGRINIKSFQAVLDNKTRIAMERMDQIASRLDKERPVNFSVLYEEEYYDLYEDEGIVLLIYDKQDLKFWNSNHFPLQLDNSLFENDERVVNPGNGWFVVNRLETGYSVNVIALILIKHEYVFENEFLINDFHPDFKLYPEAIISFNPDHYNIIKDRDGEFLFSLSEPDPPVKRKTFSLLAGILYSVAIFILLLFIYQSYTLSGFKSRVSGNLWFAITTLILLLLRYLMLETGYPEVFKSLSLFQPQHYAKSLFFPSLGDFLINSVIILFVSICFSVRFMLIDSETSPRKSANISISIILALSLTAFMLFFHYMFSGLVFNSSIQLEVYNFFYLNQFSFIAYLILAILLASLVLFTDRVIFLASTLVEIKSFAVILVLSFSAGYFVYGAAGKSMDIHSLLFFILLTGSITGIRYFRFRYTYSFQVFLVLLVSVFSMVFITVKSRDKERDIRQILVVNLANERDQVAEFLLDEAEERLRNDSSVIVSLLSDHHNDYELLGYLENNYFNAYFRKYELQVASCGHDFDLLLEDVNELVDCYSFFYDMIGESGIPLSLESDFYFLDNLNGRISYIGALRYEFDEYPYEKTLFIALDSKLMSDQLGYPELLLEGKFSTNPAAIQYSHAKYHNIQLITRSGSYSYPLALQLDPAPEEEFSFFTEGGYEHLVYQVDPENVIVISRPKINTIDILTSFSYSFLFFYLLYSIALLICRYPVDLKKWRIDFKNKIKFSMIGVLLLSLLIIGAGTVYYNIKQFENKQYENISEKIQSVLIELEYRIGLERELSPDMRYYITGLLIQLSNIFYTDINLYDLQGNLYASSRPEVFQLGLIGEQMNPKAYSEMMLKNNARFVHKESISDLSYLSAYVPFANNENQILSWLNLPYFTRQSVLTKEIYTLVVAVANVYAILILITILIAVIVSNTITKPLQLIQDKLRELSIGKTNEQIDYESDDEIGSLIKEFNRMVAEMEKSAEILARSERESAWREMAKQIAHEIKNPLTPMKLSIQHLQRAWDDKADNWEEVLKKTSRNLIEQIDHLSSIATAFSHFAKLPKAMKGRMNVIDTVNDVTGLFANTENINISVNLNGLESLYVASDKMQMNRVFINLVKNSIQSVPKDRKGEIIIDVDKKGDMAVVSITDNGAGIPPELKDKMFTPNFTTKSGGTGLGLAIVKSIIEQSGGTVGFTSEYKKGSCFFFSLPCADTEPERSST